MQTTVANSVGSGIVATLLLGVSVMAWSLPRLEDPRMQSLMTAAQGEYQQFVANPSAPLARPSVVQSWPCAVPAAALNRLAGTVNSDDDPATKRSFVESARTGHTKPIKDVYGNLVFYPVKVECSAGVLQGPVDFWVEFDRSIVASGFSTNSHQLRHVHAVAKDNRPVGLILSSSVTLTSETTYEDPATRAMMAKQAKSTVTSISFMATWAEDPPLPVAPQVAVSHVVVDGNVTLLTRTTRPLAEERVEEDSYGTFGPPEHMDSRTRMRRGRLHGEQIIYSGMMGKFPVEGETRCWEDGEQVLTTSCKVD